MKRIWHCAILAYYASILYALHVWQRPYVFVFCYRHYWPGLAWDGYGNQLYDIAADIRGSWWAR